MRDKMRRKPVEDLFDQGIVGNVCRAGRQPGKPGGSLTIVGEQTVDLGAEHAAVGRNRSFRRTVGEPGKGPLAIGARRHAHMHYLTGERNAAVRLTTNWFQLLAIREDGFDVQ